MKRFELWLDESGDFKNDIQKVKNGLNPSLIGGVLMEKGKFDRKTCEKIIPEEYFHAKEEKNPEKIYEKFQMIKEQECQFVVFSNEECISVLDNSVTYLNIMAEGIVQLVKKLNGLHENVTLEVLIANRTDLSKMVVPIEEYKRRIEEKVILLTYQNGLDTRCFSEDWLKIDNDSARKDRRLMIADVVCNTFLTRNSRKFTEEQKEIINEIYDSEERTYHFSVFESAIEKQFSEYMLEGRLGEAVCTLCQSNDGDFIQNKMKVVQKNIETMKNNHWDMQYKFISVQIEYYLKVENDFQSGINILQNLLNYFIPLLEKQEDGSCDRNWADKLRLDVYFYLLTAYTHRGDVQNQKKYKEKCEEGMKKLENTWENIDYRIRYSLREVVEVINCFDFEQSLHMCQKLVEKCKNIKEILELCCEDNDKEVKYEELAKAWGNMVQVYGFLLRKHPEYYQSAVEVSDCAIKEFVNEEDKIRQYLYRVHLETEAGKHEEALKYLYKANGLEEGADIKELVSCLAANVKNKRFDIMAYVRLMAEGSLAEWNYAEIMYEKISKTEIINEVEQNNLKGHPCEIIYWKYASYMVNHNMVKGALAKYDKGVEVCFANNELTLELIGLAIELEKYAMLLREGKNYKAEQKKCLKSLKKHYEQIYENELPDGMKRLYEDLSFEREDWNYYYEISRRITY